MLVIATADTLNVRWWLIPLVSWIRTPRP